MQLKPMGIGDILDTAFRLFRNRFKTFTGIAMVVCIPTSLAGALLAGAARLLTPPTQPDDDGLWIGEVVWAIHCPETGEPRAGVGWRRDCSARRR